MKITKWFAASALILSLCGCSEGTSASNSAGDSLKIEDVSSSQVLFDKTTDYLVEEGQSFLTINFSVELKTPGTVSPEFLTLGDYPVKNAEMDQPYLWTKAEELPAGHHDTMVVFTVPSDVTPTLDQVSGKISRDGDNVLIDFQINDED